MKKIWKLTSNLHRNQINLYVAGLRFYGQVSRPRNLPSSWLQLYVHKRIKRTQENSGECYNIWCILIYHEKYRIQINRIQTLSCWNFSAGKDDVEPVYFRRPIFRTVGKPCLILLELQDYSLLRSKTEYQSVYISQDLTEAERQQDFALGSEKIN